MKNSEHTRLVAMEMMSPLLKVLGSLARDQGMERHPHVGDAFDSSERYPTGHFAPFGGHSEWDDDANHWDGHEGIFGKDRDLYLHVKPAPQHVTHVEGANQRLHLDDEENRPVHPYIQYLQVKPGAANPGPEHAQQVYEALHRQGYTGDTMDFFAPSDSDGRRDKNGLNRRQRLYRPFVEGWKQFIRAKGYKQYPMAKSLTRRFWERKPQVGAAPPPEPAQDRPSLASRMLGKVKVTRRSGLEGASAIASNPKAAGKIALDMAAPGASAIASGVTALPKVAGGTDLSSLVHRIGSNPSAETWVSSGLGIVRGATTGLLGVLVPGGSKSIASSSVTAGPGVMDGIRKLGSDPDFASGASEWWPRKKGAPHSVLQHAIRLAAAGKQITRRGLSDALIREEMTAPIVRSPSGTFHDIPDLIGPKVSNSSGMSVYVLPEEHQTRHLGPIAHYGNDEKFGSVIQLSGHDAEAEDYKKMSEIMRPILAADKADPYVAGITDLTGHMDHKRGKQIAGTAQPWEEAEPISFDGPEHAFEEFNRKHNENGVGKSIVKKGEAEKERRAKKREKEEQEKRAKKPRYRDDDMASRMAAQERMRTAQDRIRPANRSRLERSLSSVQKSAAWQRKEGKNPKGGLNAKGRASAKREGHNLKPPVKSGDNPRRASFLARMGGSPGPEYDENGKPTRLLLALRVWGASSKADAKKKAAAMSERLKKMSKAEPNHNTSGPRSPRWQPEGGPKLTARQIAIQQRSAQKLAEIAAIPQGTPAARDASVPKRSRTRLMPKRSQGLLSTATDGHVSVAEAARILGIPHAAVTKHIERGTFPARYDGTKRSIDISHPHFAAVRDGLRQGKTMKTILYDLEEKPVTEEEKKDSYGEMYGYPQGKRRYRSSRTRTGTPKQARLGEYQRVSAATGKPDKRTSLGRAPLADPYALFD